MEENKNKTALPVPSDFDLQNDFYARREYLKQLIIKEQIQNNKNQFGFSRNNKEKVFLYLSLSILIASIIIGLTIAIIKKASLKSIIVLSVFLVLSIVAYFALYFINNKKIKQQKNNNVSKFALQQLDKRIDNFTEALNKYFNGNENRVNDELQKYKTTNINDSNKLLADISINSLNLKKTTNAVDLINLVKESKQPTNEIEKHTFDINNQTQQNTEKKVDNKDNFSKFKVTSFGKNSNQNIQSKNETKQEDVASSNKNKDMQSNVINRKVIIHDKEFNSWLKNNNKQ